MATAYPGGVDNFTNPTASDTLNSATVPHAEQHANANDAIEAIEGELGTNPSGAYSTVKDRLDAIGTTVTAPITNAGSTVAPVIGINASSSDTANYVVQRDANQSFSIGAINFDTLSSQVSAAAKLYWDGQQTLNLGLGGGNVSIALGQEVISYVTNAEATTLAVGEVVYLYGAQGDRPTVKRASNASDTTSSKTFGIVAESIAAGGSGFVMNRGVVQKVNTAAFNPGDILWLGSTPGTFTTTKPVAPAHLVFVGVVLRANAGNGLVFVSPQNGYELDEIHDVLITSPSNGEVLTYDSTSGLWKNAAPAGDITAVNVSAPITGGGSSGNVTIGIDQTALAIAPSQVTGTAVITTDSRLSDARTPTAHASTHAAAGSDPVTLAQSQVTNLTTDLAGKAALGSANAFTVGGHVIPAQNTSTVNLILRLNGGLGTGLDPFRIQNSSGTTIAYINNYGGFYGAALGPLNQTGGFITIGNNSTVLTQTNVASVVPLTVKGAASQTANLQEWQNSAGTVLSFVSPTGGLAVAGGSLLGASLGVLPLNANTFGAVIRGVSSQFADLTQYQATGAVVIGGFNSNAQIFSGSTAPLYVGTGGATTAATGDGTTATITTTSAHGLAVGDMVTVAGVTPTGYNGTFRVTAVPTTTSLSYANATTGAQTVAGTVSAAAQASVTARSAGTVGQVIRGAASQAAKYFDIQNSSGTSVWYVAPTLFESTVNFKITSAALGVGTMAVYTGNAMISTNTINATSVGILVRGFASQSANLQEWQDSAGTVLASMSPTGNLAVTRYLSNQAANAPYIDIFGSKLTVNARAASYVALTVQGVASQTANLTEWQNSGGTVLARVDSAGNARFNIIQTIGAGVDLRELSGGAGAVTVARSTAVAANPGANYGRLYFRDGTTAGTLKLVVIAGAAGAETTILDNIPQ